jgi:lysophospholipase L1-like esterase
VIRPAAVTDVTCSGATTADMTRPQRVTGGANPPQLRAVRSPDSLVTLTIGGNDIGFASIIETCASLSFSDPFGAPCEAHYTAGGTDQLAQAVKRTAPKVDATLRAIRARAPHARILLVGYPDILPNTGEGCWPAVPFAYGDVPYLRGVEKELDQMLAAAAASNGAAYVDTYSDSIGHDVCKPPKTRWVEGATPTSPAAPFHPNRMGELEMADQVLAALR